MSYFELRFIRRGIGIAAAVAGITWAQLARADSYTVHPGDDVETVVNAAPGNGPISFAPGTYTLTTNPNGPAATFNSGRQFIGNGAVIQLSGGVATTESPELIRFAPGSAISGFVFTDAQIHCEGGSFTVTGNTFKNGFRGIFVAGNSGHFDGNSFNNLTAEGIYGYPGSNCTYDNNTIASPGNDGIHLVGGPDQIELKGNVITGCPRIGIELQNNFTNLTVANNYVAVVQPAAPNSFMAYSIATGNGNNITITGNTGVSSRANAGACIEIMGSNVTISNNISWGFSQFILDGEQGGAFNSSQNVIYGGVFVANDGVSWPIIQPNSTGDSVKPLTPAPPAPPAAQVGTTPATSPTTPAAPPASGATSPAGSAIVHQLQTRGDGKISIDGGPWQ